MARRVIDISRRHVLRGGAGFTLALPFLPSLAEGQAVGTPTFMKKPRLFWFGTDHGGAFEASMFPDPALATTSMAQPTQRRACCRSGREVARTISTRATTAPTSRVIARLMEKMVWAWTCSP